ncbi:MAG: hypothetical protein ACKOZM_11200 [Flavobacteriales bacterium]
MKQKVLFLITTAVCVLLLLPAGYSNLRSRLLQAGMSWTISEWAFYALLVCIGVLMAWQLLRVASLPVRWQRIVVAITVATLPFAVGFAQHPIYEDMLWNMAHDMSAEQAMPDYEHADLVVIAIADCPYCKRAVAELNALHTRNESMRLRMVVCTADSSWMEPYRAEAHESIEVTMASDMNRLATQAGGHFPAYVLVRDGKPVCRWTNNEWGPVAKDIVEGVANGE